ncbi:MAG TPA: SDR family NAD(P)-dependent oxidoreductase [Gemmatimonadaceae bacterium]|jgi:GDP-4-dehydro-6-deoxy-D-mannose reductase
MRALITGGAGFVGQHLARALVRRGDAVVSANLHAEPTHWILSQSERGSVEWLSADFRDREQVERVVGAARADVVFHLAGVSFPPDAERAPDVAYDVNVLGAVRLLNAIRQTRAAGDPVVVIVGSAVQYGRHDDAEMPLDEHAELRPATVYAASKAGQEVAALQAFRHDGARVICVRAFNHSGMGQPDHYLLPSLASRVKRLRAASERSLRMGNDVVRDYLHVDDVVTAYLSLAERGGAGEVYNVASGVGINTVQLARDVLLRAGADAEISFEPALARSSDIPTLIGSSAKLARDTGWAPKKTHIDIIDELLNAQAD